jgi:vitamin B12 transporter
MFFLVLFFFTLISNFARAAETDEVQTLPPLVAISTRVETPQEDVTTSVTVIDEKEIKQQHAETVLDALRNVPGVDVVQSGSRGNITSVFIRGSNSNQVLVLVDGMEVNSATIGLFDFAHLPTDNVEKIEILRGAGGALYGSKAVGGVINIITKKGAGPLQATLSAEGGNGATHREVLGLSGSSGALSYSLSSSYIGTDGFRVNDDYRNGAISARLDYELIKDGSLSAIFNMTDTDLGLVNDDVSCGAVDRNAREKDQHLAGRLEWQQKIFPEWDYRFSIGINQSHELFTDPDASCFSSKRTLIKPRILSPQFQTNYRLGSAQLITFGFDGDLREAKFPGVNKSQNNQAVYLQDQMKLLDERLILVAGTRYDHNEDFGSHWTPSASAAYLFRESGTKLKASYAQGFRAPTFDDLFFPGFSNPNLKPEVSWEINAGIEQRLWQNRGQLELIYFHREVKDLIVFKPPNSLANLGQTIFDGAEVNLQTQLAFGFSLGGNYTYVNASDRLPRRPKHKGNVSLNYQAGPLNVNFISHIIGRRPDFDPLTFSSIDEGGYAKFDLASSYALSWRPPGVKQLSLIGKVENLFDRKYQEAAGFRARPLNFLIGLRGVFGKE